MLYNTGVDVFAALAEPNRRKILEILAEKGQMPASDIYQHFHSTPQAVSQHLKVLREAQLVTVEKEAQKRLYTLNPEKIREFENWAMKTMSLWQQRFDRLEKLLNEDSGQS